MRVPNFCFGWLDLISHKQFMTGCPSHSKSSLLITWKIIFPTGNLHFLLYNQRAPGLNSDLHRSSQDFLSIAFQVFSHELCPLHCYPLSSSAQGHASSRSLSVVDGCCQDHPAWETRSVQCVQALQLINWLWVQNDQTLRFQRIFARDPTGLSDSMLLKLGLLGIRIPYNGGKLSTY